MQADVKEQLDEAYALLRTTDESQQEIGLKILINYANAVHNHRRTGASMELLPLAFVDSIVPLLRAPSQVIQIYAIMALANMALVEQHQRYISGHLEILNLLVDIISRASNEDIVVKSCWLCANIALSASARSHLMNAGIIPPLVRFLGQSKTLSTAAEVLSALRNLLCDDALQLAFVRANGMQALFHRIATAQSTLQDLMYSTSANIASSLLTGTSATLDVALGANNDLRLVVVGCAVLVSLLTKYHSSVRATIVNNSDVMLHLVSWLTLSDQAVQEAAISAIADLALDDENEGKIIAQGAVLQLVDLLNTPSVTVNLQTALALTNLSLNPAAEEIIRRCGGLPIITELLTSNVPAIQEEIARLIANLASFPASKKELLDQTMALPRLKEIRHDRSIPPSLNRAVSIAINNLSTVPPPPAAQQVPRGRGGPPRPARAPTGPATAAGRGAPPSPLASQPRAPGAASSLDREDSAAAGGNSGGGGASDDVDEISVDLLLAEFGMMARQQTKERIYRNAPIPRPPRESPVALYSTSSPLGSTISPAAARSVPRAAPPPRTPPGPKPPPRSFEEPHIPRSSAQPTVPTRARAGTTGGAPPLLRTQSSPISGPTRPMPTPPRAQTSGMTAGVSTPPVRPMRSGTPVAARPGGASKPLPPTPLSRSLNSSKPLPNPTPASTATPSSTSSPAPGAAAPAKPLPTSRPPLTSSLSAPTIQRNKRHSMARISVKQRLSAEKHKRNSVVVKVQPNSYRDEMHRIRVVRELLQTEESYVAGLAKLLDVWFFPLKKLKLLSAESMASCFGNVGDLWFMHNSYLTLLRESMAGQAEATSAVGDLTLRELVQKDFHLPSGKTSSFVSLYQSYINNYDNALAVISRCINSDPDFCAFLEAGLERTNGMGITSFLIMPVQRVPRYILLLKDLQDHTPEHHSDYASITEAKRLTEEVARQLNNAKRVVDTHTKVLQLEQQVKGLGEPLLVDGRLFVREGSLFLEAEKRATCCYVFLFNDLLLLTRQTKKKYKFRAQYPTSAIQSVFDLPDSEVGSRRQTNSMCTNCFMVLVEGGIKLTFMASSPTEKQNWITVLREPHSTDFY